MEMSGWIKIHRTITNHWLYTEKRTFSKFEAWHDILLMVNFTNAKAMIKGKLYDVKRGQSIMSLDSWGHRWNWDKSKVRRFMNALQKDNMIVLQSDNITTRLTVCKYETYQGERHTNDTQTTHKRHTNELQTTPIEEGKEGKEGEEEKEIPFDFKKSLIKYGFDKNLVNDWIDLRVKAKSKGINSDTALNSFLRQIEKSSFDKNKILELCVCKGWISFNHKWLIDKPYLIQEVEPIPQQPKPKQLPISKLLRRDFETNAKYLLEIKRRGEFPDIFDFSLSQDLREGKSEETILIEEHEIKLKHPKGLNYEGF